MKGDVLRDIMLLLRELYDAHLKILLFSELGTRQFFSFETTTTQQRGNVIESLGQGKIRKILRSRCLNGVAKTNIVKMQKLSTLRPDTWSRCRDRVVACPALIILVIFPTIPTSP